VGRVHKRPYNTSEYPANGFFFILNPVTVFAGLRSLPASSAHYYTEPSPLLSFPLIVLFVVTKRCKTLSGHNVVEGKDFKKIQLSDDS